MTASPDVEIACEAINDLNADAIAALPLEHALICIQLLQEANQVLVLVRSLVEHQVAQAMPEKRVTVPGVATFEQHRKTDRKRWDREHLLRDVLDTRVVDPGTGEVLDPSPLDKVTRVWNLGAPRVTALRERGLDPDEYCESERGGWTVQVLA